MSEEPGLVQPQIRIEVLKQHFNRIAYSVLLHLRSRTFSISGDA